MWLNETPVENNSKLKKIISLYNEIIPYINCTDVWIPGQNISNIKRCIIGGDGNIIWDQWDYLETTHEDMIKKMQNEWILEKNISLLHCTVLVFDNDKHFIISTDNIQNCKIPNNVLELSFILKELWKVESKSWKSYASIVNNILTQIQKEEVNYFVNHRNLVSNDLFGTLWQ